MANNGTVTGTVTNAAIFNNNAGGTVSGLLTNNSGITTNAGALNGGAVVNGGLLANNGTVTGTVTNAGGTVSGLLTNNSGITTNAGALNGGAVVNGGLLANNGTVTGTVTNAATFNNNLGGTVSGLLTNNSGTTTNAGALNGGAIVNGGLLANNGAVTGTVTNAATFNNNVGGTVSGLLTNNSGTTTNAGALNGGAVVNGGLLSVNGTAAAVTVNAGGTLGGNGTVGNTTINGGTLAPGNSIGTLTVQGNLVFTAAASYMVEVSPATADRTNVTGTATLGGATVNASFAAGHLCREAIHHPQRRRRRQRHLRRAGQHQSAGEFHNQPELRRQQRLSQPAAELHAAGPPDFGGGLNVNQQNVANALINFFNTTGGIPLVFGSADAGGPDASLGRSRHRLAADHLRCDEPVHGPADRSVHRRTRRSRFSAGGIAAFAEENERYAYATATRPAPRASATPMPRSIARRRSMADPFAQRWSVWAAGFGGSQTTDGNAALGSNNTTSRIAWRRGRRRLSLLAVSRWPALRWPAAAPTSALRTVLAPAAPTCSRPAPSCATTSARPISPARWPMAGRTSPPTAP